MNSSKQYLPDFEKLPGQGIRTDFYPPREQHVYTPVGHVKTGGNLRYEMALQWYLLYLLDYDKRENSGLASDEYGRMFRRLKDLCAYALEHADVLDRRQGLELIALSRFYGMGFLGDVDQNSDLFMERRRKVPEDAYAYEGDRQAIIEEIKQRRL